MGADDHRFRIQALRRQIDQGAIRSELSHTQGKPSIANQQVAEDVLEATLDRYLNAKERIDTKSAVVPPAVAAIGALVFGRFNDNPPYPGFAYLLVAVVGLGAALAVFLSIWALAAEGHAIGPEPRDLVGGTDLSEEEKYRQRTLIALAIAVLDAKEVVDAKGARFNLALTAGGAAVTALVVLALTGGLK